MNNIGPPIHSDRPKVVTFGGGKGGVGRSTLCADIARGLSRHNQRVLCLDASWSCPTLHILLGCEEPSFAPDRSAAALGEEGSHIADFIRTTANANIWLSSLACGRRFPFVRPKLHADELLAQLYELDFDWVFVDLPSQCDPLSVGLFTLSDIPIMMCTPEPAAVRESTQFMRAVLYQAIGYHPEAHEVQEELVDMLVSQPLTYNAQSLRYDAPSAICRRVVEETSQRLETYLVVNMVREGAEHDLGFVLAHAWYRELNMYPRVLATIDYQDRRWFFNRRTTGINPGRSDEALTSDIELLARHIRDIALVDMKYPRPVPQGPDVHPALRMGVSPETSRNEVRQHCRRLWEGYRRETTVSLVFSDPSRRLSTAEELEELYRKVLVMPSESFSRSDVEAATRAAAEEAESQRQNRAGAAADKASNVRPFERYISSSPTAAPSAERAASAQKDPASATTPPSSAPNDEPESMPRAKKPSPGRLVENLRRQNQMSLQELSSRTHIGVKYLAAIEEVDLQVLPRDVYLRGYLREIARVFEADPQELIERYFRYLQDT
ncbi:MAG: helix-turn-helix domain-containing protein [Bradymonadaceae bacterium]|nr:helix-turn-helix domain-containing protein [Lujinxingiaceae bacterium]